MNQRQVAMRAYRVEMNIAGQMNFPFDLLAPGNNPTELFKIQMHQPKSPRKTSHKNQTVSN